MAEPLVTCIVIFLDEERFLAEAIDSVCAQTYPSWELVLVDDGSSDRSTQIALDHAQRFPDRIRYVEHPGHENRGMSAARNLGLAHARGHYVGFLDADDTWEPNKLREQVGLLETRPDIAMVYGRTLLWHSWRGGPAAVDEFCDLGVPPDSILEPPESLLLLIENRVQTPTTGNALMRRTVVDRIGGFEPAFRGMFEDQVFFMKLGLGERVFVSSQCWARYRQRADSSSARAEAEGGVAAARLQLFDWLTAYLEQQGVQSKRIWEQLRHYRAALSRPRLHALLGRPRALRWRLKRRWHDLRDALAGESAIRGEPAASVRDAVQPRAPSARETTSPAVSIVMPFHDAEAYLEEAVDSVLRQSFGAWELLLVDDGSTDGSSVRARSYAENHPRQIRYLEHPGHANLGAGPSRNLGISRASGELLAFLDADDVLLPHKLSRQINLLQVHPTAIMVHGATEYWYSWNPTDALQKDRRGKLGVAPGSIYAPPTLLTAWLRDPGSVPCLCSLVVRRPAVERVGAFDESIPDLYEDQVLLAKLVLEGPVYVEDGCSERYRQHERSSSARAIAEARYHATHPNPARQRFLEWLAAYVSRSPTLGNSDLLEAITTAQRPYRRLRKVELSHRGSET